MCDEFERSRRRLEGIAYRMCGVLADAQDIVQETHLKWCATDQSSIRDPHSWLVTVCSRLAVDTLKSARRRRETYVGLWLPEPFVDVDPASPAAQAQIDESVSVALMVALEMLTPSQRAAFLLHDVFGYRFDEVARTLGQSELSCRKLASRARKAVRAERPKELVDPEQHQELLDAFFEAVHLGELETLKSLLQASVELHADGGGRVKTATTVLCGPDAVAGFFLRIWREQVPTRESVRLETRWFNGSPGVLIYQHDRLVAAISLALERGAIRRIFALRNPDKLTAFDG
ncbi:MAG: RNA polymerase sigma factor SigJ [Nannocystaceae bacterium]|nr:RNA polymerase sigma factor SigJ [Nannocystaceae bacterium]